VLRIVEALLRRLDVEQIATTEQAQLTRAELVIMLETLRDTLLKIEAGEIDRRYVDFGQMAADLDCGIAAVAAIDES
jgi:hypothetical protein